MPAGTVSPSPAELHAPSGQPAAAQPEAKRPQLSKGEIDQRDENDKFLATGHPVMVEYHYKDGDFVPATNAGGPKIGTETRPVVVDKTLNAIKDTTHEVVRVQAARNMAGEFIDFDDKVGGPKLSRKERGLREGAAWKLTYIAANADPNARNQVVTTMLFPYSEMERVLDIVETDPRAFRRLTEATIADAKDSTTRERRLLSHAAERFDEWDAQGGDSTLQLREGEGKSLTRRDISVPSH
jgi:hypothetical protein